MYRRAIPKLSHHRAADPTYSLTCPIVSLGSPLRKRATRWSLSVNAIDHRAIVSQSSEKGTAARSPADDGQHTINTTTRLLDTKDIITDDLRATLEAHRATNRAAVIHKITTEAPATALHKLGFHRVPSDQPLAHNVEPEHGAANSGLPKEELQVGRGWATRRSAHREQSPVRKVLHSWDTEPQEVGEYIGRIIHPRGYWKPRDGKDAERPWLAKMNFPDGDGIAQWVQLVPQPLVAYSFLTFNVDLKPK